MSGPNIRLPASQATPATMAVNELLLNAVEHGLRDRRQGSIKIKLTDLGDGVELVVEDDGIGLPADFGARPSNSLGLQIVHTLVTDDLKGTLRLETIEPTAETADALATGNSDPAPHDVANDVPRHLGKLGTRVTVIFPKRSLGVD